MENSIKEEDSSSENNSINKENKIKNEQNEIKEKEIEKNGTNSKLKKEDGQNIININSNKAKSEIDIDNISNSNSILDVNISGDREKDQDEFSSTNNLDNLSLLFRDFINKYDIDKIEGKRKRQRSIYKVSRTFKSEIIKDSFELGNMKENDSINLYNIIKDRLTEVKQDTLHYLDKTKQKLEKKYNDYIVKINKFLIEKENQLSKLLGNNDKNDNFINYANNNLFKQIDDILEIHDYIFSALEDHFNLLYSFLEQYTLIQQKKPIEYFINNNSNDILNCWFLNKIDFNEINLSNIISNKELSDLCAGYLCKMNTKICPIMSVQKDKEGKLPIETELLYKNLSILQKIKFIDLSKDDINNILKESKNYRKKKSVNINNNESPSAKKLKSLSIFNCSFIFDKLPKLSFPTLKKLKIKESFITFNCLFNCLLGDTNSLMQIYIENIKLTDNSLKTFFEYFTKKKSIQETLKSLSFKGNNLTKINLCNFNVETNQLKNLQYLNFSKNNIYEFSPDNFKIFPDLKVLDLTDNNISNYLLFESIQNGEKLFKFIAFLSNNIFIHNNRKNNGNYIKYISNKLSVFQHKIKKISFSLLFNKDNIENFTKLKISPAVKISLCKLDLSFCGINEQNLWKFFQNNYGLLNLYDLNLSNNLLTDNLFSLCFGIQGGIKLEKLEMIDLSGNPVNCENIHYLKEFDFFVNNHQELKKIKLQQTSFIDGFIKLIDGKKNKDEINNIIQRLIDKNIKFVIEKNLYDFTNEYEVLRNILKFKNKNY